MMPLKNGAMINLPSHNCALRVDAYQLKGYGWLFRVNNHRVPIDEDPDFTVHNYDDWYDEFNHFFGTMIVPDDQIEMHQKFLAYCGSRYE